MRVSETAWREGMRAFGSVKPQQVVIWEDLADPKTLLLTSNAETVYALTHLALQSDGPTAVSPVHAEAAGIKAFLMKPLAKQELARTVRQVLDKKIEEWHACEESLH